MVDRHFYDRVPFPRKGSLKKTRAFTLEMVNRAYRYRDGIKVKQAPHILLPTVTLPLALNAVRGGLSMAYGTRTVDVDSCSQCGTCVEGCPVGAIRLDPYPVFNDECIGCWACFNNCPYSAILSTACGTRSYYHGIRDPEKLLKKVGL